MTEEKECRFSGRKRDKIIGILTVGVLSAVLIFLAATEAFAVSRFTVVPGDPQIQDRFGWAVSLDGNVMAIGSPGSEHSSGAVYVFTYVGIGWRQEAKLTSDPGILPLFGISVSLEGNVLLVGSCFAGADAGGRVYVFRFNGDTWVEEAELAASDGDAGDLFGWDVSVSGNVAVIGAAEDEALGEDSGSVYVFRYKGRTWVEEQKLNASDGEAGDGFGDSVSVDGNYLVAGAWGDNDMGENSGSAYVFRYDGVTWVEEEDKLLAGDGAANDEFGRSVAISGDKIVVGAFGHDGIAPNAGAAYVFRRDGSDWTQEAKLTADDAAETDRFGRGVDIDGARIAVGAYGDNSASGSVYMFKYDGTSWVQKAHLFKTGGAANDQLGWSVSIVGDNIVAGAPRTGSNSGFANVFMNIEDGGGGGGCFLSTAR